MLRGNVPSARGLLANHVYVFVNNVHKRVQIVHGNGPCGWVTM